MSAGSARSSRPRALGRVIAAALSSFGVVACTAPAQPVARAAQRFEQHRVVFEDFDRWARRAVRGGQVASAAPNEQAVGEALFAKIRGEPSVASAWVELPGGTPRTLAWPVPGKLPAFDRAVRLRDRTLGDVSVQVEVPCTIRPRAQRASRRAMPEAAHTTCTLVARSQPELGGELRVAVAFTDTEAEHAEPTPPRPSAEKAE